MSIRRPHLATLAGLLLAVAGTTSATAQAKPPAKDAAPPTNAWFGETVRNLYLEPGATEVTALFPFQNPTDQPVEWRNLEPSCSCAANKVILGDRTYTKKPKMQPLVQLVHGPDGDSEVTVPSIQIGAHERGQIELRLDLHDVEGTKAISFDIHTTDPAMPMVRLKVNATVPPPFVLDPPDVNLKAVAYGETREFQVTARSRLKPDFDITLVQPVPPELTITATKELTDGVATWTIHGTFRATNLNLAASMLRFDTNIEKAKVLTIRCLANVIPPIEAQPRFVTLGTIKLGTKATGRIRLVSHDGQLPKVTSVRFERLNVPPNYLSMRTTNDGNDIVVEFEVAADTPAGVVQGDVVVNLDHPQLKQQRVPFNGFIR